MIALISGMYIPANTAVIQMNKLMPFSESLLLLYCRVCTGPDASGSLIARAGITCVDAPCSFKGLTNLNLGKLHREFE